jgi:hypothetical protein
MERKKRMVQTTIRMDPDMLREIQYYLSLEGKSLSKFVGEKLAQFLEEYRQAHPERVPRGLSNPN